MEQEEKFPGTFLKCVYDCTNLYLNRFIGTVFLKAKLIFKPHQVYFKHFHLLSLEQPVTNLNARIKPFMDRILCLCANISVSRRILTGGDAIKNVIALQ